MNLQAYVDESEDGAFFVMTGYVASPEAWMKLSRCWERRLHFAVLEPRYQYRFKMAEMAATAERMARVPTFYRVIEEHVGLGISVAFKLSDLSSAFDRISVPGMKINWAGWKNPYLFGFRALTDVINRRRSELGPVLRPYETIDFIFDERSEKSRIIPAWETIRLSLPQQEAALYGKTPRFEDDEEFLPLQAADFWAWWVRKWAVDQNRADAIGVFPWEFDEGKPPRLILSLDEEGFIEYLTNIAKPLLPDGKSFVIFPAGDG
jgi:hypothetical protein